MKNNLIKSAFVVFVTWWVLCTIYAFYKNGISTVDEFEASAYIAVMVVIGAIFGSLLVYVAIKLKKDVQTSILKSDNYNGLICTVGEVPLVIQAPLRRNVALPFEDMHSVAKDVPSNYFTDWEKKYKVTHPAHVKLFSALVAILMHDESIPATHVPGGHGNRSLLEHSLLAAYIMDELAKKYKYDGLSSSKNNKKILELSDSDYLFNREDPLLALIGLAHDIGKIETYIRDKNNLIVGIKAEHDLTGGRMLARVNEVWDLPEADRRAIIMAVAHYHHPMSLPLSPNRKAVDDRTIAVMELLINADTAVSAIEARALKLSNFEFKGIDEEDDNAVDQNEVDSLEDDQIYEYIVQCIKEKGRINNSDTRYNVGTYCQVRGFNKPMLLLRDDSLRNLIMQKLGVAVSEDTPGGVTQMGARIRSILDAKDILVKEIRDRKYNAQFALWSVSFLARESSGAEPKVVSSWKAVNIIDASKIPGLVNLKPYHWMGDVQDGVFKGSRTVKSASPTPNDYEGLSPDETAEKSSEGDAEIARSVGIDLEDQNSNPASQGKIELSLEQGMVAKVSSAGFASPLMDEDLGEAAQEQDQALPDASPSPDLAKNFSDVFSALLSGSTGPGSGENENSDQHSSSSSDEQLERESAVPATDAENSGHVVVPGSDDSLASETVSSKSPNLKKDYQPNTVQGLIIEAVQKLLEDNQKLNEHPDYGYLLSSNTLIAIMPHVPWLDLEPILRDYCDKGKAAYKIHEPKAGKTAYVITIDKDLI